MKKLLLVILFVTIIFSLNVNAQVSNYVISNSEDWKDVYTTMQYGILLGTTPMFLVSQRHSTIITSQIGSGSTVEVISSEDVPFVVGFESLLNSRGFIATELEFENVNLGLAEKLTDIHNFIIIDDSYGYNAISVAPYAPVTDSFVLFVDENNVDDYDDFLQDRGVDNLLIYGHVDREVLDTFEDYSPEIINLDGDRFANNIEIVKKYQEIVHQGQAVLTNGEFIEREMLSGIEPVIFIGSNNVPQIVRDYIAESEIDIGVLIGNELIGTATFIRRNLGISVFVKFAQSARQPAGAISRVEGLDRFYLPTFIVNLEIDSAKYNALTNQFEITIRNTEEIAAYFKGTYTIEASDGSRQTVGDIDPVFIDDNELKTVVYDLDPVPDGALNAEIFVVYGESKNSLEKTLEAEISVDTVRILDNCDIEINEVAYDVAGQRFQIKLGNTGDVECFVDIEIIDLKIANERTTYGLEDIDSMDPGDDSTFNIKVEMTEEDIEDNDQVKIRVYYGERRSSLVKILEGTFQLIIREGDYLFYGLMGVILVLVFLIFWRRRKKKKEEDE